jgi:amidophosphoribosyltransferase
MSGIFGVVSKNNCVDTLLYGTDYHSHLGTEYGGMAVLGKEFTRRIHNICETQFKSKFYEDSTHMEGNRGIGVISDNDEQPIYLNSQLGSFCLVTSGFIENKDALAAELLAQGISFSEVRDGHINSTELVAKLITQGKDIADGIERMHAKIEGSCSLLLLSREGIYAARDRLGYTSLTIGKRGDAWAVTAESTAFPNLDFSTVKSLAPGEIVLLHEDKGIVNKRAGDAPNQICSFLWIYTAFPASVFEGINTEIVRENCGRNLAREDQGLDVDVVTGVPDSGMAHGLGYAMESGKPFRRPLVKYTPGYGRSYTPSVQAKRDLIAKMKLVPVADIIRGNSIVVCEDSIVRGTQLKNFAITKLWDNDAKAVHVRSACPPLMFPCRFCLSTRSIHELAARRAIRDLEGHDVEDISEYLDTTNEKFQNMIDWIRRDLNVTSLKYQSLEDMIAAIGLPKEKVCLYCWNGKCPGSECSGQTNKEAETAKV